MTAARPKATDPQPGVAAKYAFECDYICVTCAPGGDDG